MSKNIILSNQEIEHTIKRIAYQIYETFIDEEEIVIAGIASNGFIFAKKIADSLNTISPLKVSLCEVQINKHQPESDVKTSLTKEEYTNNHRCHTYLKPIPINNFID